MLKPNFEPPVDTAQDIIDRNMSVFTNYGQKNIKKSLNGSGTAVYKELAKLVNLPKCYKFGVEWAYECLENTTKYNVMETGTHVLAYSIIKPSWYKWGRWHRSKDTFSLSHPNIGYWTTKKWHLNEVTLHIIYRNVNK